MIRDFLRRIRQARAGSADAGDKPQASCRIEPLESERGFQVSGAVDIYSARAVREALETELRGTLVLDLNRVDFIDESGLATLLTAHKRLQDQGGSLVLRRPRGQVLKVLEITGVAELPDLTIERDGGNS
jgi:stage II sporulation protein AA (anti-sigma F factor antagonist)